jgi:chorismate--pyruvate lyase
MTFKNRLAWRAKLLRNTGNVSFIHWLRDRGSLTSRLQARGRFAVRVLRQGLAMPTSDEAVKLGIGRKRLAWVREVALICDNEAVVFAHTILPRRPRGPVSRWLACLGSQSLGARIFAHAGFSRGTIQCKRLDQRHALFHPAIEAMHLTDSPPAALWARRSRFVIGVQSLLVTEIFSPALGPVPKN